MIQDSHLLRLLTIAFWLLAGTLSAQNENQKESVAREFATRLMKSRQDVPPFPPNSTWLNTKRPLTTESLHGKFVLIDFWTYCCINCMHILPELKKLEEKFDRQLVVVGVHSAKFETEEDSDNVAEAVMRYEITHPVLVDRDMQVWNAFGASSWPTVILLDPEGKAVWGTRGEITANQVSSILEPLILLYREKHLLDESPVHFELESSSLQPTPLLFPGKVVADPHSKRLYIADTNHNRIVIASLDGKLIGTIGSGQPGQSDGSLSDATFDHPQGIAISADTIYIADTENHLLRRADLSTNRVVTIAGIGRQGRVPYPTDPSKPSWQFQVSRGTNVCVEQSLGFVAQGRQALRRHGRLASDLADGPIDCHHGIVCWKRA